MMFRAMLNFRALLYGHVFILNWSVSMKKLFCILVCLGCLSAMLGCSDEGLRCDEENYTRTCYDEGTVLLCSNGEEVRWKCSDGFSCKQDNENADCLEE